MPPSESTPTSVVPPPTSTTIEPVASVTGRLAPMAAAIGSSIRKTRRAPALSAASRIARRSTAVAPEGIRDLPDQNILRTYSLPSGVSWISRIEFD